MQHQHFKPVLPGFLPDTIKYAEHFESQMQQYIADTVADNAGMTPTQAAISFVLLKIGEIHAIERNKTICADLQAQHDNQFK